MRQSRVLLALRCAIVLAAMSSCGNATANPVLLAWIEMSGSMGGQAGPNDIDPMGAFFLQFGPSDTPNDPNATCIGCTPYLTPGTISDITFDFTRQNSPNFDDFVSHLLDSSDDALWDGFSFYTSAGFQGGGPAGAPESDRFAALLVSPHIAVDIDLIRLTFASLDFTSPAVNYTGAWEIYGTPGPGFAGPYPDVPPSPVTEPDTLILLVGGLLASFAMRKGRRATA